MRPFGDPTLVRTVRNDRGVLEYQYGLHLGREDIVSVYSRTIWLRLNTNSIVPECESKLAQGTSEFIGKLVGLDGTIIQVKNGHDASVIFGLSMSPVAFIVPDPTLFNPNMVAIHRSHQWQWERHGFSSRRWQTCMHRVGW